MQKPSSYPSNTEPAASDHGKQQPRVGRQSPAGLRGRAALNMCMWEVSGSRSKEAGLLRGHCSRYEICLQEVFQNAQGLPQGKTGHTAPGFGFEALQEWILTLQKSNGLFLHPCPLVSKLTLKFGLFLSCSQKENQKCCCSITQLSVFR